MIAPGAKERLEDSGGGGYVISRVIIVAAPKCVIG